MSIELGQLQLGQKFSFEVYAASIMGHFKDVVLDSQLSPDGARAFGLDIYALHANVYKTLPSTVPNDPTAYGYIRVRHPNGTYSIVGIPHIRPDSIQLVSYGVLHLRFNNINQQDQQRILNAVTANGYTPVLNLLEQQELAPQ